jgi:retron-type reverse transcriptase
VQWILEVDLRKFFDTVDHRQMQELLSRRVQDGVMIRLIGKWLKAGVWEKGEVSYPEEGTPQGGVICQRPGAALRAACGRLSRSARFTTAQ